MNERQEHVGLKDVLLCTAGEVYEKRAGTSGRKKKKGQRKKKFE